MKTTILKIMKDSPGYTKFNFNTLSMNSELLEANYTKITKIEDLKTILKQVFEVQREFIYLNQKVAQKTNWMLTIFGAIIGFIIGFCLDIFLGLSFSSWLSWFLVFIFVAISTITAAMIGFKSKRYLEHEKIIKNLDIFIFKLAEPNSEPLNMFLFEDLKLYKNLMNGILLSNKEINDKINNQNSVKKNKFDYRRPITGANNTAYIQENAFIKWNKSKIPTKNWKTALELVKKYNELAA